MSRFAPRSLRVRLTLWYACALVLLALTLAGASRWALAVSLDHALDQSLRYRLIGLQGFMQDHSHEGLPRLSAKLRELNHLGELFQVFGPHGELLAQSDGLARHHVRAQVDVDPGAGMLFRNDGPHWFPIRIATQRVYIDDQPLVIEVADPQVKYRGVLTEFYSVLLLALPIVLTVAVLGGYWLSGRALQPVDQIIQEAQTIDPADLSARLTAVRSGAELQRLSETLNQMLARVEASVLQMRRFTADASHELRAPMTLIYTAAQFALRRERNPEELKEALRKVLREAARSTELMNQLLSLARSDAGLSRLELVETDLAALANDVVAEVTMLAASRSVAVSAALPPEPVLLPVDEHAFRRMLLILLDNAIKYTPSGGEVILTLRKDEGQITLAIADTGVGLSPEQLPYVFDRFWRADNVRSRDAGGTGLGLAIAQEIARNHGAELGVKSMVGRGTVFTVRLRHAVAAPREARLPMQAI